MGFLIEWRIMRLSELGPKSHSARKVLAWPRGTYQNYGISPVSA
ncbi:hypothetical protein Goklo_029408 [Gossypium klotzschianum]|uniref:Uncharacterized protein n=1 Tax=Gossypium klotzschianum TaxID=34286 RepID=A0A7J8W5M1_9ROSI|nr:hypothetical protein [Gossypium klotzschianum]